MAKAKEVKEKKSETKEKTVKKAELVAETTPIAEPEKEKSAAKAGKRSAKSQKEAEEKLAKEDRKTEKSEEPKVKPAQKPPRSKEERAGKKYRELIKKIDKNKTYNLTEALELATKTSPTKFDSSVEMHINLIVDPKQADQNIRGTVVLPSGSGKTSRIAVFAEGDDVAIAKTAGADIVGSDNLLAALDKEQIDFDVLISAPTLMARLGKYAKLLGPKGLMPNPKSGTVTTDIAKAVKEAKGGKVEYRVDQAGIVHLGIGKVSFGPQKLQANADAVVSSIRAAKPASIKGAYIKSVFISSTMGPSIRTDI